MANEVVIDLSGWTKLQAKVDGMAARARDLTPVLDPMAGGLDAVIEDSYRLSQGPNGEVWEPLSARTIDRRRKNSSTPLVDSGKMREASGARRSGKRSIVFGVSGAPAKRAPTHQFGRRIGKGEIPARPFLPIVGHRVDFSNGRAAQWWARARNSLVTWILEGKVV